jgi:fatty-acid desaturase
MKKIYNVYGWALFLLYALACIYTAPARFGPWWGLAIGAAYFLATWFVGGTYLSSVIHMGIAHRALDYKPWFLKTLTLVNNTFGVYVNPITWVNRHRLHHKFSDHPGDPNKLAEDGFWRTLYLCLFPYKCTMNVANDEIFRSWSFRFVSNPVFALLSQIFNYWLLAMLVGDWRFAAAMWGLFRVFAIWINMVQNYWTHDRRYGYRRYDDARDNAMNIGDWLPVMATFSACLQNNHHHSPGLLRLSHDDGEWDMGFRSVKWMQALGLVKPTAKGRTIPEDCPLPAVGL